MAAINEVVSLRICIDTILAKCESKDIKEILICVCSRTTEDCIKTIHELREKYPETVIQSIEQPDDNNNLSGACRVTFDAACGTHILAMSSDLECNPEYVPELIRHSKQNPDMLIKASRWIDGSIFDGYGAFRKIANKCFQIFMKTIFGSGLTDYTYPFLIAPAGVLKKNNYKTSGKAAAVEMVTEPIMRGVEVKEIPVVWRSREEFPEKKHIIKDTKQLFYYFSEAVNIRFKTKKKKT